MHAFSENACILCKLDENAGIRKTLPSTVTFIQFISRNRETLYEYKYTFYRRALLHQFIGLSFERLYLMTGMQVSHKVHKIRGFQRKSADFMYIHLSDFNRETS